VLVRARRSSGDPESAPAGAGKETDVTIAGSAVTPDIDATRWPDVAVVPHSPVRAAIARRLFHRVVARIPLRVVEPSGRTYGGGGSKDPILRLIRPAVFFQRVGTSGSVGFGEAYMAGDWTADDLSGVLCAFAAHLRDVVPAALQRLRAVALRRPPASEDNTVAGARRNIQRHYDLSNEMFALFLDPTMTYSGALFAPGDSLTGAQRRKNETLLDLTGVGPATTVLEIGTGWGELAIRAAARGAQVTTLTISSEQAAKAGERAAAAGLADRVDVRTLDYREVQGHYDVVLSVEMIEAVGEKYWPAYVAAIDRLLAPGGRAGLQAITMPHDALIATRHGHTWIQKYIFPGGQIPSLQAIGDVLREHTALRISSDLAMGTHYARTLAEWRSRFTAATDEVARLGFSPAFQRMWNLYLAYAEAGFRARYLDVHQLILQRPS
jgi:cyclopropane-fatty-acyl-phospholipid synthase